MKILHIDETFHPNFGYHCNPLAKFQQAQGHTVYIATVEKKWLYPLYKVFRENGSGLEEADAHYENTTGVKIVRVSAKGYYMRRLLFTKEIFDTVNEIQPDVVYVHCVETITGMRFLMHPKMRKFPMVFDSHMLPMATRNQHSKWFDLFFKLFFSPIIRKYNYTVIRTQDDDYVNTHLGIPKEQTPFVSFGTDTMLFHPDDKVRSAFRKEHNIPEDAFVMVYTGKLSPPKNGKLLALSVVEPFPFPFALICVGQPPPTLYGKEVYDLIQLSANQIVKFKTQHYTDLPKFYQAADLSVFPKQCSMSFYDAQACGLPVLSENNDININRCSYGNGFVFNANDVEDFRAKIIEIATMDPKKRQKISHNALSFIKNGGYDYAQIAQQYTEHLQKAIDQHNQPRKK